MTEQQGAAGIGSGKSSERNHGEKYRMGGSKAQVTGSGRGGRFGCRRRDATGACEQCGRSLLPQLHEPCTTADWVDRHHPGLLLYHQAGKTLPAQPDPSGTINLLIGPEGGLSEAERRLAERDIGLRLTDAARDRLGEAGFDPVYGARPLKRAIRAQLENPLAQEILAGRFQPGQVIEVDLEGEKLVFRVGRSQASAA